MSYSDMLVWLDQGALVFALEVVRELWHSCLFSHKAQTASTQMFSKIQWGPMVWWLFNIFEMKLFAGLAWIFQSFYFFVFLLNHKCFLWVRKWQTHNTLTKKRFDYKNRRRKTTVSPCFTSIITHFILFSSTIKCQKEICWNTHLLTVCDLSLFVINSNIP